MTIDKDKRKFDYTCKCCEYRGNLAPEDKASDRIKELEGALREVWKICRQCDFESAVSQVIPIAKNALGGSLRRK